MNRIFLFLAALFFLASCNHSSEEKQPEPDRVIRDTVALNLLKNFYESPDVKQLYGIASTDDAMILRAQDESIRLALASLKNPPQKFKLNPSVKNEIKGSHGTKISFPQNCFVDEKGKEVSVEIEIEMAECYSVPEMLAEDLTTTCSGNLMNSKGVLMVGAYSEGKEILLKDGEKMQVEFPFAVKETNGYSFYSGEKNNAGKIRWSSLTMEENSPAIILTEKKKLSPPQFSFHGLDLPAYLEQTIHYPDYAKTNELSSQTEATIMIDENGMVKDVQVNADYMVFRDEVTEAVKNLQGFIPASLNGNNISASLKVNFDFNLRKKDQIKVEMNKNEVVYYAKPSSNENSKEEMDAENSRTYSFAQLGFINCAQILPAVSEKADIIVQADEFTDVKIVFKNHSCIAGGVNCIGYSRFRNIPADEEVYLLALRNENGNLTRFVQLLKPEKQNVITPVWQKTSEKEIAKLLSKMKSV